jgi:Ca2+-transporting ATPase
MNESGAANGGADPAPGDPPQHWWSRPPQELLAALQVDPQRGISPDQVASRREKYGRNTLGDGGRTSLWTLLWESVKSPMMVLLLAIAAIALLLGQLRDAVVMVFVVAMYVGVHVLNKARSDRTMARLREVQAPTTTVLRSGQLAEIPFDDVVAGDILPLRSGSRIPADARLVSSAGVIVDESALTGESAPVHKQADAEVAPETPLAERQTAVFAGTTVLDGQGKAVVVAVGRRSELGRIAKLSTRRDTEPTPLQREMSDLTRTLAFVAVGVSLAIPLVGLLRGFDLQQMLLTWLSLTFLMVPGQPPIIIAMALALAALELARRQVIVRRLQGAETLGAVNVVLSDKTGTITENKMRLSAVLLPDGRLVELDGRQEEGPRLLAGFFSAALPAIPEDPNDPTDLAIVNAAGDLPGFERPRPGTLVDEVGFSRGGAYRSLEYRQDGSRLLYVAGRPEYVLERSNRKAPADSGSAGAGKWSPEDRERLLRKVSELAGQGKRITAYALGDGAPEEEPHDLALAGMAVISDATRPEVKGAVEELRRAGVRTAMVTGDIVETAVSVAGEVGIDGGNALTGSDLQRKSDAEMEQAVREVSVYARTTPEQKLRLVRAFQRLGQTVAVTGDGINDAPALHTAHIGIAMGQTGTDVAREAADLVLTDDSFAHLPDGVAIGRKAYDNFRKGITYYLSAKAILLAIFIIPLLIGIPFPLAPIQIIFTELLMDLASSTIFVTESAEPDVMRRPPRPRTAFLSWQVARRILRNMAGLTVAILAVYFGSLALGYGVESARTAAFATWLLGHIILALNLKQEKLPLFRQGLFSNRFAAGWLAGMIGLVLAMTFVPVVQNVLQTTGLSGVQWLMVAAGALLASMWLELVKWLRPGQALVTE